MSKQPTVTTISSGFYSTTALNANFENIRDQFDNTLSLDGSTPNSMSADFDLNSQDLLNGRYVYSQRLYLNGVRVTAPEATPTWQGEWVTSTSYAVDALVRNDGNVYICIVAHTSGTFSTDLAANNWELFAAKGSAGAGTGDLLAANNLSDVSNADTALANLGGSTEGLANFKSSTEVYAPKFRLDNGGSDWEFTVSGNNLIIKYSNSNVAKIDTSGNLTVIGDVTAFGAI